jgi:glycogen synthase
MRILVVSNLYPPHHIGGYELGCRDVLEGLKSKGHEIRVLTSTYGVESPQFDGEVYRYLKFDLRWPQVPFPRNVPYLLRREWQNQKAFKRVFETFRPEIVYIWNLMHVSTSLALLAERSGVPVCHFVSDKYWSTLGTSDSDPWLDILSRNFPDPNPVVKLGVKLIDGTLGGLGLIFSGSLTLQQVHFVSEFLKQDALQAGKRVSHGEIIPWGVDLSRFRYKPRKRDPKRLLYVGQISPGKGFGTVIEVMRLITETRGQSGISITIVGASVVPDYLEEIKELVRSKGLQESIQFAGAAAREDLPEIYQEHDILLFPSLLDEALTITTLEAMACGLAVVATATGGNPEVLRHGFNALVFAKEDAESAASHVARLLDDTELFEKLSLNGRRTVEQGFDLEEMTDKIESSLRSAIGKSNA